MTGTVQSQKHLQQGCSLKRKNTLDVLPVRLKRETAYLLPMLRQLHKPRIRRRYTGGQQ
jgi:hypothetical protein